MKTAYYDPVPLSKNSIKVLESRYLKRNALGSVVETPEVMFRRVANAIAQAELSWGRPIQAQEWEEVFFDLMRQLKFLPNSPTLMNAGQSSQQLSACFVLPVKDHLEDIFSTLKLSALIQQSGGGTGFNFSHLRPKNDLLHPSQGKSSGPVSFMKIFDAATEHIKQGGKRRGANMGVLNIDHPDVSEFIASKEQEGQVRNFNISLAVTDAFMERLEADGIWELVHPGSREVVRRIRARTLWDSIVYHAWLSGDPGLIFIDTINASNPTPLLGMIEATNPCGEVPLLPYESCNLGSINVSRFLDRKPNVKPTVKWAELEGAVSAAVRFLDNVIEVNSYLCPEIREITEGNRKIGLGIMGWAEMLSILEIPYESEDALLLADKLMKFIERKSHDASGALAIERGTFKNWQKSVYYPHIPLRNATLTSIAPTGTISIIADTSSSIEPFFALAYRRTHVLKDEILDEVNKNLLQYLETHHLSTSRVLAEIVRSGTLEHVDGLPAEAKSIFKTALEIHPEWHIRHQAAFQKYTDNAVSKTINLPQSATPADVSEIYLNAWRSQLKGITIFRNSSRVSQVMHPGISSDIKDCKVCIEY